jgi:hypothetical protein
MSDFIKRYGGNTDTMKHSGLNAVNKALAAGLTVNQIRNQANDEGISFGYRAQDFLNARSPNLFISQYGGNEETMAHSGMNAVTAAMRGGLTPAQIDQRAKSEGVQFGYRARDFLDMSARQVQEAERQKAAAAAQKAAVEEQKRQAEAMQKRFDTQMLNMQNQMRTQQESYLENMAQMTNTMNANMNPNTRESVLGVKGAGSDSSNTAKLNRQGMKGSFARTGLRIKSLNI